MKIMIVSEPVIIFVRDLRSFLHRYSAFKNNKTIVRPELQFRFLIVQDDKKKREVLLGSQCGNSQIRH